MIEYICDKNGEPIDVRKLTAKLRDFPVTQGATSDGRNIYMIFERRLKSHRCRIVKLDAETLALKKVSGELRIGHGNDAVYKNGILYITHSKGNKVIHRVNAETLEQMDGVKVTIPGVFRRKMIKSFNGIARYSEGFILRVLGSAGMLITDDGFTAFRYFRTSKFYKTSQGMDQKERKTYRAYSRGQSADKNYVIIFDDEGKEIWREQIDVTGEMESIFFVKDDLYGTVYRRTKDDHGRLKRSAYVFRIKLS